jgi:hypothetical protein
MRPAQAERCFVMPGSWKTFPVAGALRLSIFADEGVWLFNQPPRQAP